MKLFPAKCHERATLRKLWRQTGNSSLLPAKCWPLLHVIVGISARFSNFAFVLFCYITNHLMTGPLGNNEFCFPRISMFPFTLSWETLRFLGNKIHCSPRDQSLSVNCQAQVHTYEGQTTRGLLKASVIHRCLTSRFHVALQVSVLSKVTDYIKMGENKNVIHEAIAECSTDFLTPFWHFLWSFTEQTVTQQCESTCFT